MPYVCFQIIYYVYYNYGIGINTKWTLEYPKFSLWYLLVLFVWKVITPYFKKVPHFFLISLILGLSFGCLEVTGTYLSISRIVVFYPFFLAGMLLERGKLEALRTYKNKCVCTVGLVGLTMFSRWMIDFFDFRLSYFYGKECYGSLGMGNLKGIWMRLICYALGFLFTYIFTILMTEKRFRFSKLGSSTISIYLFHGLLFKFLEHQTSVLDAVNTVPETIALLAFCVGIPFVFSLAPFCEIANLFGSFSFKNVFGADLREKICTFMQSMLYIPTYNTLGEK